MTTALALLLFPAIVIYSAVSDLLRMTISNRVSLALALTFFPMALLTGLSLEAIGWHMLAGALVLTASFACFAFGWIGGGDAKIASAAALWFGFEQLLPYLLNASLFGGALTLGLLSARNYPLPRFAATQGWILRLHDMKTGIPYGIALAAGALVVYPDTVWMTSIAA
jgi:prepilin peptidase CpaA